MASVSSSSSTADATKRLHITHVDTFGPYLRIYGQMNPDAMTVVRNRIQQMLPTCSAIDPTWPVQRQLVPLRIDALCLYKSSNGPSNFEFKRVRILDVITNSTQNATHGQNPIVKVEVEFVDYGGKSLVSSFELLFELQDVLSTMPATCNSYILLGICKDFKPAELDEISRIIKRQTLDISIDFEFKQFKFISMKWKEFNFAEFLIHQKNIGAPIGNDLLRDNFAKFIKQQQMPKQQAQQPKPTPPVQPQQTQHLAASQQQQQHQLQKQTMQMYAAASSNINNNNYYAINPNNNLATASGIYQSVGRSVGSRLNQYQLQQQLQQQQQTQLAMHSHMINLQRPMQPRLPHTVGNLRSLYIPYVAPNYQQSTAYNGFSTKVLTSQAATTPPIPNVNAFNIRSQRPTPYQQSEETPSSLNSSNQSSTTSPRRATTATFKTNNLSVGKTYDVYVSFVENGPCLFSVQLAKAQDKLTEMMNRIERVQLQQFSDKPVLGTACIARYSEDGQLYRALITGVQATACKVVYIDYGNAELVKYKDLYEIPDEFLESKAFAIRFTLSGHKDLEPIDESLKKAFKDLMMYKNCQLKVMPLEGPPLVQYCELYLQQQNNVLDVLKEIQKCRLVYPKSESLNNNDIVEIRYIDSPKHFYVQKVDNIAKFETLMDDMYLYYNKNQVVPNHLVLGAPCIVKYDNEWYRAEVMRADSSAIIVRHVDFGYEQKVTKNLLSTIAEKHLKLPRQAVQCCLKGFENNELNKDMATNQFEMLAEESNRQRRSFTVKVFRIQPDGVHLVNLCTKDLNVMKKLYKLSMPFEQYLTLEKEEFNIHSQNGHQNRKSGGGQENGNKTPSIASSNDAASLRSSNKKPAQILNSTTLQSDEHLQQKSSQQQQQQQTLKSSPRYANNKAGNLVGSAPASSVQGTLSVEWDKQSSASSMENRDARSSSSEIKYGKRQSQQHQQRQGRNAQQHTPPMSQHNESLTNTSIAGDRRSVGSGASSVSSYNHKPRGGGHQIPPRFQNEKRRQKKEPQEVATPKREQRPQNAPQGYSQQRNKTDAPTSTALTQRANDVVSEVYSNASETPEKTLTEEYVALNQPFPVQYLDTPSRDEVIICWWISPHQFYTHLKSRLAEFEQLMSDIQQFYKQKSLQQLQLKVGSYVIARYRKENRLYRARILACNQMLRKYKVHFVDVGNQYTVTSEDIWQVEKRFASLPVMAYLCSFSGIVSNYDHLYIIDRMEKYLPVGATLNCEYIEREQEMYYVNVKVNGISLKETLKSEGIITEVAPELRLSLLAGQQIRVKITYVKDMLNFKIHVEGMSDDVQLLSSFDDVRYVKSNPDIAMKFKQFYEGKSCVVNIKDVNDNKVILLRPLVPLLKDDIAGFICQQPVVLERFEARVVHVVNAYRMFVHTIASEGNMTALLNNMYEYYENGGTLLDVFEPEQLCAALGSDGNWYRARITTQTPNNEIEVRYIDYGNTELLDATKLKQLENIFYTNSNTYAIELNLPVRTLAADAQHKNSKSKKTAIAAVGDTDAAVIDKLKQLTLVDEPVLNVKALEVQQNHLIAELQLPNGDNVVDVLLKSQLIKTRDLDFMRKQLEKDTTNLFEYIEKVDLTLEEEDDSEKKGAGRGKNSPKKKKQVMGEEKLDKPSIQKMQKDNAVKTIEVAQTAEVAQPPSAQAPVILAETPPQTPPEVLPLNQIADEATLAPSPAPSSTPSPIPPPTENIITEPVATTESETESVDPYADMEHACLSHCDNPGQFFIHPYDKLDELRSLQENLQIVAQSLPPLMSVVDGAYCISLYSVDKQWYRARIMDAELMVLQFIDFGNTDCVTDTTDVKEMSVFPNIEPLCMPCALPIKPNGTADWVDAANAIFNLSYGKLLNYEYITRGDKNKRSFINLYIDGINIAERLVEDGFAKHLELVDTDENCFISHVNSISDFYIQYEKDSKALELIEIYLAENENLAKITKFGYAKIVAALFPDDEMWYRAKLLKEVPNEGYEVLFIDYGNTSISPECREISEEIAKLPPLSKKCSLEVPENCVAWSEAAEKKFAETAAQGETIFTVELREPADKYALVHLFIDGHNINDDLEPLCEHKPVEVELNMSIGTTVQSSVFDNGKLYDALISHTNSPIDFYVQFSKDTIRLEDVTKSLNTLGMDELKEPKIGQLCAAVYNEDRALYRARILGRIKGEAGAKTQYRVIFIDYGTIANTDDVRILPHDLHALPEFARHCQLAGVAEEVDASKIDVAIEAFLQLVDECEALVKIEFIENSDNTTPPPVKLYTVSSGKDLGERLYSLIASHSANASAVVTTPQIGENTCVISHAISPAHFYTQPKVNSLNMELVTKALTKSDAEQLNLLSSVEVGWVCCVYSAEDDCYYRGRVLRVLAGTDGGYEIFLIDYGNIINATIIRELPANLCAIPALAWKCKLNAIPDDVPETLLNECFSALVDAHFGEIYDIETDEIEMEADEQRIHIVKLHVNYKDLAEELAEAVSKGDADKAAAALASVPTLHDCCIIHVNSPASFYIQLAEDVPAVEKITDVLLDAENDFEAFNKLEVGAICAAQFPDDLAFYRAEIVHVLDDGACEVHYLDFGNNAITSEFRTLPQHMLETEGYSKHCALDVNFAACNDAACSKFTQLIDSRFSETFQVEFLKTTVQPQICRIFYQDKNVANEVLQLVRNGGGGAVGGSVANGLAEGQGGLSWEDKESAAAELNDSAAISH